METQAKPTLIITFFFTILIPSSLVHTRNIPGSRSSAPIQVNSGMIGKNLLDPGSEKVRSGPLLAHCQSKCNQCMPCMPVEVIVRVEEQEENDNYLLYSGVERCKCHDIVFTVVTTNSFVGVTSVDSSINH